MLGTSQVHTGFSGRVTDQQFKACCQIIADAEELLETLTPSTRVSELDQAMVVKIVAILQGLDLGSKAVTPLQPMCASLATKLSSISKVPLTASTTKLAQSTSAPADDLSSRKTPSATSSSQTAEKSNQSIASSPSSANHSGSLLEQPSSSLTTSGSATENTSTSTTSGSATENTPTSTTTAIDNDVGDWDLFTFLRSNLPHDNESSWWNMLCSFVTRAVSTVKGTHVSG